MRKLCAIVLSFAVIYGITQINTEGRRGKKSFTYHTVNAEALQNIQNEIINLKNKANTLEKTPVVTGEVKAEVIGASKFVENYQSLFNWLRENKVLYRHQVSRSFEKVLESINQVEPSQVEGFNQKVAGIVQQHLEFSQALKFSPEVVSEFQDRLRSLANPLEVKRTPVATTVASTAESLNFDKLSGYLSDIKEERNVSYETHGREVPNTPYIWVYLAGLAIGILGFASFKKKSAEKEVVTNKSDLDAISGTLKRVLKELNYPVLICDSNFNINWQNLESEKLNLSPENIQNLLSDSKEMERCELDNRSYTIRMEELKYKSGKVSYVLQMVPQTVSPRILSHIVNGHDVERILENSLQESKDFKGLNQLVAENAIRMNYLFKVSAKVIDVDFDENLSECFIESNRLNDAVREFMMANYHLIKDDSKTVGLFLRTSEKGQRFNLNCFIPGINRDTFATSDASKNLIQKLSSLESKFNLYYPRVSFRWISTGEAQGVDICLSLENKSELETILKESNA